MDKSYNILKDDWFFIYAIAYCNAKSQEERDRLTTQYKAMSKKKTK